MTEDVNSSKYYELLRLRFEATSECSARLDQIRSLQNGANRNNPETKIKIQELEDLQTIAGKVIDDLTAQIEKIEKVRHNTTAQTST